MAGNRPYVNILGLVSIVINGGSNLVEHGPESADEVGGSGRRHHDAHRAFALVGENLGSSVAMIATPRALMPCRLNSTRSAPGSSAGPDRCAGARGRRVPSCGSRVRGRPLAGSFRCPRISVGDGDDDGTRRIERHADAFSTRPIAPNIDAAIVAGKLFGGRGEGGLDVVLGIVRCAARPEAPNPVNRRFR